MKSDYQIILTRAAEDNFWLERNLLKKDFSVLLAPSIAFANIAPSAKDTNLIASFLCAKIDCLIFTSRTAVKAFREILRDESFDFISWPKKVLVATVGKKTASAFKQEFGFYPQIVSEEGGAKTLVKHLINTTSNNTYLLIRPKKSLPEIEKEFLKLGQGLSTLAVYETKSVSNPIYSKGLERSRKRVFVFFSPSSVDSTLLSFTKDVLLGSLILSVGSTTSAYINSKNLKVWKQSPEANEESVLNTLLEFCV